MWSSSMEVHRWLQFSNNDSAGGIFVGENDPDNNISSSGDDAAGNNSVTSDFRDIAIGVVVGIFAILGLLLMTYVLSVMFDHYCYCCPWWRPPRVEELDDGPVSRKAGLTGLLQSERRRIVEYLFPPEVWSSPKNDDKATTREEEEAPPTPTTVSTEATMDSTEAASPTNTSAENEEEPALYIDDDDDDEHMCCICLAEYQEGCQVMHSSTCSHMFHYDCCMEWLQQQHDQCPYCRVEIMTATAMREAAVTVLGQARVDQMDAARQQQHQQQQQQEEDAARAEMELNVLSLTSDEPDVETGNRSPG